MVKRSKVKVKKSGRNLEIALRAVYGVGSWAIYFLVIIQMAVVAGSYRAYVGLIDVPLDQSSVASPHNLTSIVLAATSLIARIQLCKRYCGYFSTYLCVYIGLFVFRISLNNDHNRIL